MRKLIIFAAIGVCTSSSSGEDPENAKKTSGLMSSWGSAAKSMASGISAMLSELKEKKVRNMAFSYIGGESDERVLYLSLSMPHPQIWGKCVNHKVPIPLQAVSKDTMLEFLSKPGGVSAPGAPDDFVHDGRALLRIDWGTAIERGRAALMNLERACADGWLNAWALPADLSTTCRDGPPVTKRIVNVAVVDGGAGGPAGGDEDAEVTDHADEVVGGGAGGPAGGDEDAEVTDHADEVVGGGAGGPAGGDEDAEVVNNGVISARLLECLQNEGPPNLSTFGRKLYKLADQVRRDYPRAEAPFGGGDDPVALATLCEELAYIWVLTIVPWYDYSQGSVDLCMYIVVVRRGTQLDALRTVARFHDQITRLSRYPEELQDPYQSLLASRWERALKQYFPEPFKHLIGQSMSPFYMELIAFLLRPTLNPEGVDFIITNGRPGLFAFYVAAVEICHATAIKYLDALEKFLNGELANPHNLPWDFFFELNIRSILGTKFAPDRVLDQEEYLQRYLVARGSFERGELENPGALDWESYFDANENTILGDRGGVARIKKWNRDQYMIASAYDQPDMVRRIVLAKPDIEACVGRGQIGTILRRATEVLVAPLEGIAAGKPPVHRPSRLGQKHGLSTEADEEEHEKDGNDVAISLPPAISFSRLVELIDTVVDHQMVHEVSAAWMPKPVVAPAVFDKVVANLKKHTEDAIDLKNLSPIPSGSVSIFVIPEVGNHFGGSRPCVPKLVMEFGITTSVEAVNGAIANYVISARDRGDASFGLEHLIEWNNPRMMIVDGLERTRESPERYEDMTRKFRAGLTCDVDIPVVFPGCARDLNPEIAVPIPIGCKDPIAINHAWALQQIEAAFTRVPADAPPIREECREILGVYATVFMNSPDAIMDGEPVSWCNALPARLNGGQTVDAIAVLGNKIVGQTKFGPQRSRQYIYTLASYWLMALKTKFGVSSRCPRCFGPDALEMAVSTIKSFGGCLDSGDEEFWNFIFSERKNGLFALFHVSMKAAETGTCADTLTRARMALDNHSLKIPNTVRALEVLVDGAMQRNPI
jgi:hypothetical protein